jgi:hypothetical protein
MPPPLETRSLGTLRTRLGVVLRTMTLAALLLLPVAVVAGWFDRLTVTVDKTSGRAARPATGALENAVRHIRSLPAKTEGLVLAAQGTQEGHWRFVNKSGEMLTVGTPDEMKRVISVLYPEAKGSTRLMLYMTQDTVLRDRAALKALPVGAELNVVVGGESYRLVRRTEGTTERLFAEIRSNLVIELGDRRLFEEAFWQLSRPLKAASVRVLALEPGGPSTLSASPRIDPTTKRALVDVIDPVSLAPAMGSVSGQTLLILGRIDHDLLYVKPSSGPERSLLTKDLFRAADNADVNLIVLQASTTPRQPGGRNWLWQRVEVKGLEEALQHARLADFLNALGAPNRRLAVVALPVGRRTVLDLTPAGELPGAAPTRPVSELFYNIVSDITGKVATASVQANLRSAERQQELDKRLMAGVSSDLQIAYLVLAVLGLIGVPVSRAWWSRIWPPEVPTEYAGRTGYWAARTVRALAFWVVFLPLTAVVAAPHNLATQIWEAVTGPARFWRRLTGRQAPAGPLPPRLPGTVLPEGTSLTTPSNSGRDWPVLEPPGLRQRYPNR